MLLELIHAFLVEEGIKVDEIKNDEFIVYDHIRVVYIDGTDVEISRKANFGHNYAYKFDMNEPDSMDKIHQYVLLWRNCL